MMNNKNTNQKKINNNEIKPEINDAILFEVFGAEYDRYDFPVDIQRVTSGNGGESFLIFGSEKTLLYDCGMAYCGDFTVKNIMSTLESRSRSKLDYIALSHSHYDHIGALPYIKRAFPEAIVCGSKKAASILIRPNARALIKRLGTSARDLFMPESQEEILADGLSVDLILEDGDEINLGDLTVKALETKGHTDCSMSYAIEPVKLLFASESTGLLEGKDYVHTPILKDYNDAVESRIKCMEYNAKYICLPHFGLLPQNFNDTYWELLEKETIEKYNFISYMAKNSFSEEDMLNEYVNKYLVPGIEEIQPKDAFMINARAVIKAFLRAV